VAGDEQSYHQFLTALSAHLRGYFRKRLVQLPGEIEDLVQESLLAVHNQRHTYDAQRPLTSWVHAIAKYKLIDLLRRRSHRESQSVSLDDANDFLSYPDTDAADARRDLLKLLDQLPERQRLPIVHTKLDGLSVADAAKLTGMSESAVKVGVHRGLKALAAIVRGDA